MLGTRIIVSNPARLIVGEVPAADLQRTYSARGWWLVCLDPALGCESLVASATVSLYLSVPKRFIRCPSFVAFARR
jgi:hypothetical protein